MQLKDITPKISLKRKHSSKIGKPPGSLILVGTERMEKTKGYFIEYNADEIQEDLYVSHAVLENLKKGHLVGWLNVEGLSEIPVIEEISSCFGLHPLLVEDVLNTDHRPKSEAYDSYVFISLKMIAVNEEENEVVSEQISMFLGNSWLVSFQEQPGDVFDGIRTRLRTKVGNIREKGADFLFYRLIDTVVDHYYLASELNDSKIDELEDKIISSTDEGLQKELQLLKRQVTQMKRDVYPLREAIGNLVKDEFEPIGAAVRPYLKDVYDHVIQLHETVDIQRESLANLTDLYHASVGQKTNKIMQTLTIVATVFIPLTFIVGIYGMNFDHMPELHWKNGYYVTWALMGLVVLFMFAFFRRKKWL